MENGRTCTGNQHKYIVCIIAEGLARNLKSWWNMIVTQLCHVPHQLFQFIIIDHDLTVVFRRKFDDFNDSVKILIIYCNQHSTLRIFKILFQMRCDSMIR